MAQLVVLRGKGQGERLPLEKFPAIIGREGNSLEVIVLADEEVSRQHFLIKKRGRLYILQDLDSKNGTYVNGDRVHNSILRNGDKILVGSTELSFISSEARIQLGRQIHEHKMIVDEEGEPFSGSRIVISQDAKATQSTQIKLGTFSILQGNQDHLAATKLIYDLHANLLVITDIHEAARTVLKFIHQLLPSVDRATFLMWPNNSQYLTPFAVTHFTRERAIRINKAALEEVINRKQGILIAADPHSHVDLRALLPVIHNNHMLGIIHLESTNPNGFPAPIIDQVNAFLARCAPSIESMYLRQELDAWLVGTMETMISAIEAKDTYTYGHSERVSRYCMAMANELKLDRHTKKLLLASSLCHDVGKVGIPDNILKKAALLSPDEYEEMKLHPTIGADIISHLPNSRKFISGVKYHHEKWDGTGYPEGLVAEEIPFFARIVCIADVFDAMVSGRSYSGFMDQNDAAEKLASEAELFDPEVLKAFVRAQDSGALTLKTSTLNQALPDSETEINYTQDFLQIDKKEP